MHPPPCCLSLGFFFPPQGTCPRSRSTSNWEGLRDGNGWPNCKRQSQKFLAQPGKCKLAKTWDDAVSPSVTITPCAPLLRNDNLFLCLPTTERSTSHGARNKTHRKVQSNQTRARNLHETILLEGASMRNEILCTVKPQSHEIISTFVEKGKQLHRTSISNAEISHSAVNSM